MLAKITTFIKETKLEMKRVNWLTKKQLTNFTLTVIAFSLAVAIFLGILDFIFRWILGQTII